MVDGYPDFSNTDEHNYNDRLTQGQVTQWKTQGADIIFGSLTMDASALSFDNQNFLSYLSLEGLITWEAVFNTTISGTKKMIKLD
jgi:hypothetical protein